MISGDPGRGDAESIRRGTVVHLTGQLVFAALALLWAIVVARSLGVAGKGAVSAVLLIGSLSASIGIFGSREGLAFHVGRDGPGVVPAFIRISLFHALVVGALASVFAVAAQATGIASLQGIGVPVIVVAGLSTGLLVLGAQLQAILISLGDISGASIAPIVQIASALVLFGAAGFTGPHSISSAVLAYVGGLVLALAFYSARLVPRLGRAQPQIAPSFREYWGYCAKAVPSSVAQFLNYRFDQAVIAASVGATGLGVYSAAVNVSEVGGYPAASVSAVALPFVAKAKNGPFLALRILWGGLVFGAVVAVALWIVGPAVLRDLFGPGFDAGVPVLKVLLIAAFASGLARIAASLCSGLGHPEVGGVASVSALAVTLIGCVYAIPHYGILGAAWVSLCAYSLAAFLAVAGLGWTKARVERAAIRPREDLALVTHLYSDSNAGDAGITEGLCEMLADAGYTTLHGWSTYSGGGTRPRDALPHNATRFEVIHPALWAGYADLRRLYPKQPRVVALLLFLTQAVRGTVCLLFPWASHAPIWSRDEQAALHACQNAEIVVSKGGGFLYCESARQLPFLMRLCLPIALAGLYCKRVILCGQTIGPLRGWLARAIVRRTLISARAQVWARESRTAALLQELGIPEAQVGRSPDCAFRLVAPKRLVHMDDPCQSVAISVRPWEFPGHEDSHKAYESYLEAVAGGIRYLHGLGFRVTLAAQVIADMATEDDRRACRSLLSKLDPKLGVQVVEGPKSPREWIGLYRDADLVIATRAHATIFAICAGTPVVTISYNPKGSGIMEDCGLGDLCLSIDQIDSAGLVGLLERVVTQLPENRVRVLDAARRNSSVLDGIGSRLAPIRNPIPEQARVPVRALVR